MSAMNQILHSENQAPIPPPYLGLQDSGIGLLGILGANKVSDESDSCSSFYTHEFG